MLLDDVGVMWVWFDGAGFETLGGRDGIGFCDN
jgi:hypothetical protein